MSDSMSSSEWVQQFYEHHNFTGQQQQQVGPSPSSSFAGDATVVTTAASSSITSPPAAAAHLNPEGRVSKPTRRRRASRTAPTTLLNTDTTNFRAMVQQFTGVPNAPFTFGSHSTSRTSVPNPNFGIAGNQSGNAPTMMPPNAYYNQPPQQQYMFSLNNTSNGNEGFVSGFNNSPRPNLGDDFFRISSQEFPRSSPSNNDNSTRRNNGYNM